MKVPNDMLEHSTAAVYIDYIVCYYDILSVYTHVYYKVDGPY